MSLTPSQQTAFQKFEKFVNSGDRIFILKGSAGTGKTTLLKALVDKLCSKGWKCVLMAPTGRASYILGEKTGHPAATIHRTIYQIEEGLRMMAVGNWCLASDIMTIRLTIPFISWMKPRWFQTYIVKTTCLSLGLVIC